MTFTGTCTALLFNIWVKNHLVPKLKPRQTVVMDNASIHKGKELEKIIKDAGCTPLYLLPYSPDLNPIEHLGANLKGKIRSVMDKFDSLTDALKACYPCENL